MSNSMQLHRWQPTRLPCPWDSPGKNTGVGCHFLLQCMKVKSESEVAQSCLTLSDPMDCSPPGSSAHRIFQARGLEWGAIAFSVSAFSREFKKKSPTTRSSSEILPIWTLSILLFVFALKKKLNSSFRRIQNSGIQFFLGDNHFGDGELLACCTIG